MRTERPREVKYLILGASTCESSVEMMHGSWYSSDLDTMSLLLPVYPSDTCFGEVFVLGTSAKAIFAFDPRRKFLFPGREMSLSRLTQNVLGRTACPEQMNGLIFWGFDFILSSVPERVQAAPSHQSCRIATLSRADTTETVIGIIFARSKMVISSGTKKA